MLAPATAQCSSLLTLSSIHRDEKAEQERRRALDEDDNETADVPLDPNAKPFEPAATAKSTPQPDGEAATAEAGGGDEPMEGVEQEEGEEGEEREEGEMNLGV